MGDAGFLQKPVEEAALLDAVRRFTGGRRPHLLVVDDEPAVRKLLDKALTHFGFQVTIILGLIGLVLFVISFQKDGKS